ncbi:acetylglutamate kinase [Sporosarcina sp. Marseille-Q4943]|uniref:acetylglutamate kinase n=1 Tax=Sporosarcina sp. Marseille-Q4943 TaxID=2942204 RepID=UPI00208DB30E|nr:acetylglutamate kinase [Sporosarcina sp. Marseille-Q4943]
MTTSKSMLHTDRKRIVIKLGGSMLEGLQSGFFKKFQEMQSEGKEIVIVHGGGPSINAALQKNAIESNIINGIRVTCERSISIVKDVLIGDVNPSLVHQLNGADIHAVGLSGFDGKLLTCTLLDEENYGFVGDIQAVNDGLLEKLFAAGIVPVISCIGATECGKPLNINADTVASKVALAIGATSLVFVSDTPGIKIGNEIQTAVSPGDIVNWIEAGDIYGGMIPKVHAAMDCLDAGVPSVQIVDQHLAGTTIGLEEVFS